MSTILAVDRIYGLWAVWPGRFRPVWPVGLGTAYVVHWSLKGSNLDEGFLGHIIPDGKWAKVVVTDIGAAFSAPLKNQANPEIQANYGFRWAGGVFRIHLHWFPTRDTIGLDKPKEAHDESSRQRFHPRHCCSCRRLGEAGRASLGCEHVQQRPAPSCKGLRGLAERWNQSDGKGGGRCWRPIRWRLCDGGAGCSIGVVVEVIRNTQAPMTAPAAPAAKEDVPHTEQQQM